MRIALFSETFPPQRNGVAILLERLVRHLAAAGHEVFIASTHDPRLDGAVTLPHGVTLAHVPGLPLYRYPDLRIAAPYSRRLGHAARAFRPDIVHVVTEYGLGLIGLGVARRMGVPAVSSFHTNIPRYLPYYGFGWAAAPAWRYLRWFHNRTWGTYCPSEPIRAELIAREFRNVRLWARGVDTARFTPTHRSADVRRANGPPNALQLLYVGRLTPEKDLTVLFRAFERARGARPGTPMHLVLAGDGAYSPKTRAAAPRDVTFTGYLEGDALSRIYASSDVFVFPSRTETLGNVVLEALASGLPVIGAHEGGVPENVRDGVNGLLFEPGDADALAARILELADHPGTRAALSANARRWAETRTWDAAFGQLVAGYEEAARS